MEPAELGADLPRPLSRVVVDVVCDVPEDVPVVRADVPVALNRELIEHRQLLLHWRRRYAVEHVAHLLAPAVLDSSRHCVGDVVHEVSRRQVSATEHLVHVVLVIRCEFASDGIFDVVGDIADDIDAGLAAALTSLVEVEVVHAVVLDDVDDARGGPGGVGRRVQRLEPRREGAWVAAADRQPLVDTRTVHICDVIIQSLYEVVEVSEGLG